MKSARILLFAIGAFLGLQAHAQKAQEVQAPPAGLDTPVYSEQQIKELETRYLKKNSRLTPLFKANAEKALPFQYRLEMGKPVALVFSDGREATLYSGLKNDAIAKTPFRVTDNSCTGETDVEGEFIERALIYYYELRWTKHPDISKVGHLVESRDHTMDVSSAGEFSPARLSYVLAMRDVWRLPIAAAELKKGGAFSIASDTYAWLPGGSKTSPPQEISVLSWGREIMTTNAETGINENQNIGGAKDVVLKSDAQGKKLELASVGAYTSRYQSSQQLLRASTLSWILAAPGASSELCEIGLKSEELLDLDYRLRGLPPEGVSFAPYIMGQDELLFIAPYSGPTELIKIFYVDNTYKTDSTGHSLQNREYKLLKDLR